MSGFVYRWTDFSNGMRYVGSHKGSPNDGYIGSGKWFLFAYNKRPEVFSREVLYEGNHYRELEEFILEEVDAKNSKEYYNLKNTAVGGDTRSGKKNTKEHNKKVSLANKGRKISKEQRRKISESLTGKEVSSETKKKMSESRKGCKNSFYNKKHTQDSINKMKEKIGKKVYVEKYKQTYRSVTQASQSLCVSVNSLYNMINGRTENKIGIIYI